MDAPSLAGEQSAPYSRVLRSQTMGAFAFPYSTTFSGQFAKSRLFFLGGWLDNINTGILVITTLNAPNKATVAAFLHRICFGSETLRMDVDRHSFPATTIGTLHDILLLVQFKFTISS
jgi:hypothetical protein